MRSGQNKHNHINFLIILGKNILKAISSMLETRDNVMLMLTCQEIHAALVDYKKLTQLFFPMEYKVLALKNQQQQILFTPPRTSFLEEKKEAKQLYPVSLLNKKPDNFFKQNFRLTRNHEYKDLSERDRKLFDLFKLGALTEIIKIHVSMHDLKITPIKNLKNLFNQEKILLDEDERGLLEWAWINGHQLVLNYCYDEIFLKYARHGPDNIIEELWYAMLCQQTTVLIDTLLLRCSANIFAEETLPKRRSITTLDIAAAHGYLNVVKKLLSSSNNIAEYFYIKSTKEAILYDHLEVVEYLVSNFKGSNDQIHDLILTAVEHNKIKVVDYLFGTERMAGMNPVKMSQCICYAIQLGYFEMVQCLLSLPFVKIDHEMLKAAINYKWPDIIKHIVDRKKQLSENAADYNMLMIAALEGDDAAVHYLIEQGLVDVNGVAPDGTTALFCALQSGKISLVKYLIERQANANAIKKDGTTLLMKAVELGFDQAIVEYFLMSCDINAATKNGLTALMYASLSGRTNIVELFVNEYNASIDAVDRFGATALVYAAKGGHFEIVKFLVEKQTDSLWLPAQCILALKEININQLKEVNIELWNDRGRIINNGCYISYNVPNAFLIIARYLISQPVLIDSYFSDEHNNFIPDLVMQRIHQDVLDYLAIMDVQDSLYSLSHYYLYNKKTANYAETLCVNLLISIKQALPMPNKQLISLIDKFLCFKKLLKIVSCHFVAALREIQEKLRWLVKTTETEEEKPFSLESNTVAPLLLLPASQDKAKITSSWRGGFSLFSFCCGNDSAALEENRLPQSPSHFPSPVSSSS